MQSDLFSEVDAPVMKAEGPAIRSGFEYMSGWTEEQLSARLTELSEVASARRRESDAKGCMLWSLGGAGIDYMTPAERAEMHGLKLALPSTAEQVMAAKVRVQARVAERRARRQARETAAQAMEASHG